MTAGDMTRDLYKFNERTFNQTYVLFTLLHR
jgi:hypothetical protein